MSETHASTSAAPLRVAVSGASGLIGHALVPRLRADGHTVLRLVRRAPRAPDEVGWDPERGTLDAAALDGVDGVVHLAGENVAEGRWTEARKRRIRASRVESTRLLATAIAGLPRKPSVLVSASAIGIYGDRGDERLDEMSAPGSDFLAGVVREWEAAAAPAAEAGIRVACLRFGVVLAANGGALAKMLPLFRLGAGGPMGSGGQWVSWISLDDVVELIVRALHDPALTGAVNAVAGAVTNQQLADTLGRVLHRPALIPVPAFALRLALGGEMANGTVLASQRVEPRRLTQLGFAFHHPELEGALRAILGNR
ncbi:MAG TPA: TIGR01777 family oxidoreductase, partial [Longimicrobium sp.]|nr:TIGR01777 family oxidoreductase [Longimicrobium sp.]